MEGEQSAGWRVIAVNEAETTHVINAFKENQLHLERQTANLNSYTYEPPVNHPDFIIGQQDFELIHHLNSSDWAVRADISWQGTNPNCVNFEQGLAEFSPLWEPTAPQNLSAENQLFDYDNLSASSQEVSDSSGALFESMAGSSTTQSELPEAPSTQPSTSIAFSNQKFTDVFPQTAVGSQANSKKRRHRLNSASCNDTSSRKWQPQVQPKKALARFQKEIWSNKKFSNPLKPELRILFNQFNELFSREVCPSDSASASAALGIVSEDLESNSGCSDSENQSDMSSNSATPRQPNLGSHEDVLMDDEPVEPTPNLKRFQCTFPKCKYSSNRQGDWERHEAKEKHWPQERFMCLQCNIPTFDLEGNPMCRYCSFPFSMLGDARTHYLQCGFAREGATTFGRKDHLCEHLRVDHGLTDMNERAKGWSFPIYSEWPRQCGFCGIFLDTWEQRMKHIGHHYQNGAQKSSWKLPFPQPKDDMPHGTTFDPSDDDSDDEDDDFSNGCPPHEKAPSHSFQHTSSRTGSSSLPLSTYLQNGSQMQQHQRSQQSHIYFRYHDNSDALTPLLLASPLLTSKPSLPLQRYLNDTEDAPFGFLPLASLRNTHKKNFLSATEENRFLSNQSKKLQQMLLRQSGNTSLKYHSFLCRKYISGNRNLQLALQSNLQICDELNLLLFPVYSVVRLGASSFIQVLLDAILEKAKMHPAAIIFLQKWYNQLPPKMDPGSIDLLQEECFLELGHSLLSLSTSPSTPLGLNSRATGSNISIENCSLSNAIGSGLLTTPELMRSTSAPIFSLKPQRTSQDILTAEVRAIYAGLELFFETISGRHLSESAVSSSSMIVLFPKIMQRFSPELLSLLALMEQLQEILLYTTPLKSSLNCIKIWIIVCKWNLEHLQILNDEDDGTRSRQAWSWTKWDPQYIIGSRGRLAVCIDYFNKYIGDIRCKTAAEERSKLARGQIYASPSIKPAIPYLESPYTSRPRAIPPNLAISATVDDSSLNKTRQYSSLSRSSLASFPQISRPIKLLRPSYDVEVIRSGYGRGPASSRMARGRQSVCLLERGKEKWPGEFPSSLKDTMKELHVSGDFAHELRQGHYVEGGDLTGLYHLVVGEEQNAFVGNGLGGTSLLNAKLSFGMEPGLMRPNMWPEGLKEKSVWDIYYQHDLSMRQQDMKPNNILVSLTRENIHSQSSFQFNLADPGISHFKSPVSSQEKDMEGDSGGTHTYVAAECFHSDALLGGNQPEAKQIVDIWSLGALLTDIGAWATKNNDGLDKSHHDAIPDTYLDEQFYPSRQGSDQIELGIGARLRKYGLASEILLPSPLSYVATLPPWSRPIRASPKPRLIIIGPYPLNTRRLPNVEERQLIGNLGTELVLYTQPSKITKHHISNITRYRIYQEPQEPQYKSHDIVYFANAECADGNHAPLELLVCRDQSGGKSLVLEALTDIPFPRNEQVQTRFPIESYLRGYFVKSLKVGLILTSSLKKLPEIDMDEPEQKGDNENDTDQVQLDVPIYNQRLDKFGRAIEGPHRANNSSSKNYSSKIVDTWPDIFFVARKIPSPNRYYSTQLFALDPINSFIHEPFHSHILPGQQRHGSVSEKPKHEGLSYSWEDQATEKEIRKKDPGVDLQNWKPALLRPEKNETSFCVDSVCINQSQKPRGSSLFALKNFSRTATHFFDLERDILLDLDTRTFSGTDQDLRGSRRDDELFLEKLGLRTPPTKPDNWNSSSIQVPKNKPVTSMTRKYSFTQPDSEICDIYKKKPLPLFPANKYLQTNTKSRTKQSKQLRGGSYWIHRTRLLRVKHTRRETSQPELKPRHFLKYRISKYCQTGTPSRFKQYWKKMVERVGRPSRRDGVEEIRP